MIFDAQDVDRSLFDRTFDACVIGSGPAGMTIARQLAAAGLDVALMEGGALDLTEESQDLYVGEVTGLDNYELDVSRLRFFGGSSNHWNGRCRPLDDIDFQARSYHPLSGWPIGKADLDPYQGGADKILDLTSDPWPVDTPIPEGRGMFQNIVWRRSPPTRFASKYQDEIAATANLALCLNSNLVDMRLGDGFDRMTGAVFKSFRPDDPGFTVTARFYCLCLGGLENPRALLNSRSQMPEGIGNRNGLVGRNFFDHVAVEVADILFQEHRVVDEISYAPTRAYQDAHQALNMGFMVTPRLPTGNSVLKEILRTAECATPFVERLVEQVRGVTLKCRTGGFTEFMLQNDPAHYPSGFVWAQTEQPLTLESRITLNDEKDPFGLNRITMDWEIDPRYYQTLREATLALGEVLAEQGVGRLKIRNWLLAEQPILPRRAENVGDIGSRHHMGTTRMADDPGQGVVDADCRVHGLSNLYIGGSSVFPTGGYANPTYTIVQLSLRLADHLVHEIEVGQLATLSGRL